MSSEIPTPSSNSTLVPNANPASIDYIIQPSDSSSLRLVFEPFAGNGYGDWKRSMLLGLSSKNKTAFIRWFTT